MTTVAITENIAKLNKLHIEGPYNLREVVNSKGIV